jgi:hypothetical protein|tara:strand:+ start:3504 stop:4640 length:1137 start_codon:yes stop_codon:yes gene_type:complete
MDELQESHAPQNMRSAYRQLQQLYGEENIPLILGTEMHGGKTDMVRIEVGKDQMMLCLLNNYHKVPAKYRDSSPFFVLGHEFGHIVAHPGKDAVYWIEGMRELPVEAYQKGRWLNCVSDILVNWTVITGTGVLDENQKADIRRQMLDGWKASQFVRRCSSEEGFNAHDRMLKDGTIKIDNRYQPKGGLTGQYDFPSSTDKYIPTAKTPFYQKHIGHGRGEQYYPPINYCVAEKMGDNWRKVVMLKSVGGLKIGKRYTVEATKTFDGRIDVKDFEPIKEYKINGEWISARHAETRCPQCGLGAKNIWDNWWDYIPKDEMDARIANSGTWRYLLIQMFAFEWAMAYSTLVPYGNMRKDRATGEQFLEDIAEEMDGVMRSK